MKYNKNLNKETELPIDTSLFFDLLFKNSRLFARLILDEIGTILKVSEGVKTLYGYAPEDLLYKEHDILFTEQDKKKGIPAYELLKAKEAGTSENTNYILHKNGSPVWSSGETVVIKSKEDDKYFIKTIQNVDQQKILEGFLKASEQKQSLLSRIFDSFVSGIEVFKSIRNAENEIIDFEYMLINKAAEKIMQKNRNELVGKALFEVYPELKNIGIMELQKRVVETGKMENAEFFYDKLNTWFKAAFAKFGDGLILTFEDITGQKSTNEELEKTTTFLLESQELSHVCNFEWDINNDQITGTPELYHLFGIEQQTSLSDFMKKVCDEDRDRVQSAFLESVNSRSAYEIEYKIKLPDGSTKTVFERARIVFDGKNKPIRMIGTVADVTNIKCVEGNLKTVQDKLTRVHSEQDEKINERTEELLIANKQLMKIIEELDKYAFIVSHDLRSPLNSMEGLIFLLGEDYKNKPLDAEGEEMLDLINNKIQNMKEFITQVLKSAKSENRIKEPLSLTELVQEVIQTLNPPSHFHIFIAKGLPRIIYHKTSLIQIFLNLIGNSIKYMNKEYPLIAITSVEREKEYEIRVCDNGSGIPKEKRDKIFDLFEVGHDNEKIESHGLGLSIVKKLVEENGGSIRVESNEGKETSFCFTIPKY